MCTSFAYGLRKQKGARSGEQIVQSSNHVQTNIRGHVILFFEIRSIRQDRPPPVQIVSKHSVLPKPVLRPFCLETIVYSPLPFVFLLTLTQSSARNRKRFQIITRCIVSRTSAF